MKVDIKVPAVGESVKEAVIAKWMRQSGEAVKRHEPLLLLESDKASFEVIADADGVLEQVKLEGDTVAVGSLIGRIDPAGKATHASTAPSAPKTAPSSADTSLGPASRRAAAELKVDTSKIQGSGKGGRVMKDDIEKAAKGGAPSAPKAASASPVPKITAPTGGERRVKMTPLRSKIAQRLVEAQHKAAILTTFNEIDMSALKELRKRHKESYKEAHGVSLGFMGFFTKACVEALKKVPGVNARIEGEEIVYQDFWHIGVAVSTERGLVVPVLRNADQLSVPEIDQAIAGFAGKARDGKLSLEDMSGGTFTVSNGGVFGSLLSTPILNPPQSGILGMHKIEDRPVAVQGRVEIRPMMYVALSYDHRLIDGREAVSFLATVKDYIECPARHLLGI
ncbi:MAG: 2-oxoglutarate dehydrogenase complex dihydrolipoyllysine-residue succinyltransferase [Planctomycetota bacterium]